MGAFDLSGTFQLNVTCQILDQGEAYRPGARLFVYAAGTDVPGPVFRDPGLTEAQALPLVADAAGAFPALYVPPGAYKVVVRDESGAVLSQKDDIPAYSPLGLGLVRGFPEVAALLADRSLCYGREAGRQQVAPGALVETAEGGFVYRIAPAEAADAHLATAGGVKLHAVPVAGLYMTPEQLGYSPAAANWGAVAQIAWNAGYVLRLGPREYLTSTTAYIRSRTGVVGEGDRVSGVKAVDGFDGNVIDTESFAALRTAAAVETDSGLTLQPVLKDFYIDGNRARFAGVVSADNGIGVRLYCRMPAITNLRIVYCAAHGMQTALDHGAQPASFNSLDHSRIGFVEGLTVMDCGYEGWIFQGPADIPCNRVFVGNNGRARTGIYDALNRTTSLVFPGETVDGLVLDNVGAEFSNGHSWNHQHGRGIRIRTDRSGVRARFFNMISEGNWGQVDIGSGARVEFYGEIHGNDGGPRNERVFYDAVNVAGSPFAVGQTLTGMTSGAVGTITSVEQRTATSGLIIVSFASDAARERRFADNERVTNGTRQVTVHRPDYYGAVPWWRDDSMQGNLVSLKVFQTGLNDGGTMLRIGGQNHVYTVQCQSSTPRFGHGIDLYGDNVTISGYMEGRARTAPNGQASAGLIVRAGAERANIDLTVRSCQQNVLFEDPGLGSRFDIASVDPIGDHMNGLAALAPAAWSRARLTAVSGGAILWENRTQATADVDLSIATLQEIALSHGQPIAPAATSLGAALSWKAGATTAMPVVEQLYVYSVSATQAVVRLKLAAGGRGVGSLALSSLPRG